MPFLQKDDVFYEGLTSKKYDAVKANILKMYIANLESKVYPMDILYPNQR